MQINDSLRAFAALLYNDSADVERSVSITLPNGSSVQRFSSIITDLPCRLSRVASRRDELRDQLPLTEIDSEARLYCDPDVDIRPGDRISLSRDAIHINKRSYIAGEAFCYPSHLEIPLQRSSDA